MKSKRVPANKKWFPETIIREAEKHRTITEWMNSSMGSYIAARRLGVLVRASSHMKRLQQSWDKASILADARKYKSRSEWRSLNSAKINFRGKMMAPIKMNSRPPPRPTEKVVLL